MGDKQYSAFVTAKKGFCYLTIKIGRQNFHLMRIRNYTLDAQDKRDMRRLHPDIAFDWKKIGRQLAEKREACRCYRSRRRTSGTARLPRAREPLYAVYDPITRTVYADPPAKARERCLMPSYPSTARWACITENSAALVKNLTPQMLSFPGRFSDRQRALSGVISRAGGGRQK